MHFFEPFQVFYNYVLYINAHLAYSEFYELPHWLSYMGCIVFATVSLLHRYKCILYDSVTVSISWNPSNAFIIVETTFRSTH